MSKQLPPKTTHRARHSATLIALALCLCMCAYHIHAAQKVPSMQTYTNCLGMNMIPIQPGSFRMGETNPTPIALGGPPHLPEGDWDERPVRAVTIDRPFHIAECEVTVRQYRRFDPDYRTSAPDDAPAAGITWNDAVAFCEWLTDRDGRPYRLPTEAEWEYACRAGTDTPFWSGQQPPEPGQPNPWGLRNIHSGPAEWCLDWHARYPHENQTNPAGPATGIAKIARGGGLQDDADYYARSANRAGMIPDFPHPRIGFRVVQAPPPPDPDPRPDDCFARRFVKTTTDHADCGPPPDTPYFKKRRLLPVPPENVPATATDAAGINPALLRHNHSPALEALPNGDLLAVYYTAPPSEYTPDVALMAARLRFGHDRWDMPALLFDLPDANDHAPLLWNDGGTLHLFWGGPGTHNVPFRWTSSHDHGATWEPIRFPRIVGPVGGYSPQPINTAFRDEEGTMYLSCDGAGRDSLLWASRDDGNTWFDTGGRTGGRHTTFVLLEDGTILGMGGKKTDIDGYMPKSVSTDKGNTWQVSKTPFPALENNQRPCVIRLDSGRLFFASDYQDLFGNQPEGVHQRGAFVALSDDAGETWKWWKKLPQALPHETVDLPDHAPTLGYCVARQAPNGVIHLITSMNHPCLHFAMNEAWIMSDDPAAPRPDLSPARTVQQQQQYPDGALKAQWSARITAAGQYLLHGTETWYYETGTKAWQAEYESGRKIGRETFWRPDGSVSLKWQHREDGVSVRTDYWPNGRPRSRSMWKDKLCIRTAKRWSSSGELLTETDFRDGIRGPESPAAITFAWSTQRDLDVGQLMYGDRNYVFSHVPDYLRGAEWIRPANNSSDLNMDPTASFRLAADADVYVAHDNRARRPDWLKHWRHTDDRIVGEMPEDYPMDLFVRRFKEGQTVELGWNGQLGGAGQYVVIVTPVHETDRAPIIRQLRAYAE